MKDKSNYRRKFVNKALLFSAQPAKCADHLGTKFMHSVGKLDDDPIISNPLLFPFTLPAALGAVGLFLAIGATGLGLSLASSTVTTPIGFLIGSGCDAAKKAKDKAAHALTKRHHR